MSDQVFVTGVCLASAVVLVLVSSLVFMFWRREDDGDSYRTMWWLAGLGFAAVIANPITQLFVGAWPSYWAGFVLVAATLMYTAAAYFPQRLYLKRRARWVAEMHRRMNTTPENTQR